MNKVEKMNLTFSIPHYYPETQNGGSSSILGLGLKFLRGSQKDTIEDSG